MISVQQNSGTRMNLFIYIPSFNRPKALEKQLTLLSEQTAKHKDQVRILVSDNSSPSNAYAMLEEKFSVSNISFRRNPGNIGGNANIALGFTFARQNEFLWILSDNDFVNPNSIKFLLNNLIDNVDFINIKPNSLDIQEITQRWTDGYSGILIDGCVGLISLMLYNMKSISSYIDSAFYFHNSSFPHLAVILATIKGKSKVRFRVLPYNRVIKTIPFDDNQPGDYSLSSVGMPLLVTLMTKTAASKFCAKWLCAHGVDLHANRIKHPSIYIQTVATLKKYGRFNSQVLLFWTFVRYKYKWIVSRLKRVLPGFIRRKIRAFANLLERWFR